MTGESKIFLRVALDVPASINPSGVYDYVWQDSQNTLNTPERGDWVVVPFGRNTSQHKVGLVLAVSAVSDFDTEKIKVVVRQADLIPRANENWMKLIEFASHYYHRHIGALATSVLPPNLRQKTLKPPKRIVSKTKKSISAELEAPKVLTQEQSVVMAPLLALSRTQDVTNDLELKPHVLFGVTGSGKTEVYLQWIADCLAKNSSAQVLVLVPEIALTPQLAQRFSARFGADCVAVLHSERAQGARAQDWLAVARGEVSIVLGTRSAVFAMIPNLKMIIVDEEHDPSFKQQDGVRYHARDLAIVRAHQLRIPILLGSATPSLETWYNIEQKKFVCLTLSQRAHQSAQLPKTTLFLLPHKQASLLPPIIDAVKERLARKEQVLFFLNRRGFAPALFCESCRWIMPCTACDVPMVWHRTDKRLHCHQCGLVKHTPPQCLSCGEPSLTLLGLGTQRVESELEFLFPDAKLARLDADLTPTERLNTLNEMQTGSIDILVGTQMLSKGHDFSRVSLVVVVDADQSLYSQDFRASERLFATLLQVAGRAGRGAVKGEVMLQTRFLDHPLFGYLQRQSVREFALHELQQRRRLSLPPYTSWAILRFEHPKTDRLEAWLSQWFDIERLHDQFTQVQFHQPVKASLAKKANVHRWQLLIESPYRSTLHKTITALEQQLHVIKSPVSWVIDIDPQEY